MSSTGQPLDSNHHHPRYHVGMRNQQRPLKTYSTKRGRRRGLAQPEAGRAIDSSSPSLSHSQDDQDITLTEMSKRMIKRAFPGPSTSVHNADSNHHSNDSKRPKTSNDSEGSDDMPQALVSQSMFSRPLADNSFQTPRLPLAKTSPDSTSPEIEQFSPLPVPRRILSHSTSKYLKENVIFPNGLASPFSSRPSSRSGSPMEQKRRRGALKSRTLSSNLSKRTSTSALPNVLGAKIDLSTDPTHQNSVKSELSLSSTGRTQPTTHARTSSIPTMSSSSFGSSATEKWFIPTNVLSRSPQQLNDQSGRFKSEHPSFYFDIPLQVSTPAQAGNPAVPRNAGRTQIYSDDSDAYMSDASDNFGLDTVAAARALIPPASPRQPQRRRRTILHVSSDSIFSSPLDFSAYITDEDSPGHIRRTMGNSGIHQAPRRSDVSLTSVPYFAPNSLDPAFSPDPFAVASKLRPAVRAVTPRRTRSSESPRLESDELGNMFSGLALAGTSFESGLLPFCSIRRTLTPDMLLEGKSGKVDDSRKSLINAYENSSKASTSNTSEQQPLPRRKRGDTIRASDFKRSASGGVPLSGTTSTTESRSTRSSTRRTRSGTVTLSYPGSASTAGLSDKAKVPAAAGRRRKPLPTIKMKIDDDPLPPQGSDEEDDELLLTGEIWMED